MQWRVFVALGVGLTACGNAAGGAHTSNTGTCGPGTSLIDGACVPDSGADSGQGSAIRNPAAAGGTAGSSGGTEPDAGLAGSGGAGGTDSAGGAGGAESAGGAAGARGGAAGASGTGGGLFGAGGTGPGVQPCMGVTYSAERAPKDLYIMLDQSTSMGEVLSGATQSKWDAVLRGIHDFVSSPDAAGTGVALQYFGLPDECNSAAYAVPEIPMALLPGVAQSIIDSTRAHGPSTLTPTYPALAGALDYMVGIAQANAGAREAAVVLITDGFPTRCQADGTPSGGASIQDLEDLASQYVALDPPIRTFVIGVGEALANLNSIAEGGGTERAILVETRDVAEQLAEALTTSIRSPGCEFPLPTDSSNERIDPSLLAVHYTSRFTGITTQIVKLSQPSDCVVNGGEGWYYDHPTEPRHILACPGTCARFASGTVEIVAGCRPIYRE